MKIKNLMNELRIRLSSQELVEEIKKITTSGNPLWIMFLQPLIQFKYLFKLESKKPFYGFVDEKTFKITLHDQFFLTPYIIEGYFLEIDNEIKVKFDIKRIRYIFLLLFLIPISLITILVLVIYDSLPIIPTEGKYIITLFSLFFILISFSPLLIAEFIKKKQLEKRFISSLNHLGIIR